MTVDSLGMPLAAAVSSASTWPHPSEPPGTTAALAETHLCNRLTEPDNIQTHNHVG